MKTKQLKMENNIIATISVLHVILGFTAGMAFASLIQVADRYKLYNTLEKAKDEKFNQDLRIDRLMDQLEYFENRNCICFTSIRSIEKLTVRGNMNIGSRKITFKVIR